MEHKKTSEQINEVKDFLLFKVLYEKAKGDQEKRFELAYNKLQEIRQSFNENKSANDIYLKNKEYFNQIKDMISNNGSKANDLIRQIKKYFKINETDKKELIKDLSIIFKSKKYEIDLKSIFFFFENFQKDNKEWNKNLIFDKKIKLSEMDLNELKKYLDELQKSKIYDYQNENKSNYNELFTSLYEKKEAIDFLISKKLENINILYDKLDPTNRTITIKNLDDTKECIEIFNQLKEIKDNFQIFEYIKKLDNNKIDELKYTQKFIHQLLN